jgi:RHS repeat-associated protein
LLPIQARPLVDQNETVTDSYTIDVLGRLFSSTGSTRYPYRFGGDWGYITDTPGSGLLQLGARTYWPEIGRFIQQDPAKDGVNWYAYVGDDPLTGIDPEGLAYLEYTGGYQGTLTLYHDTGNVWVSFPGRSGLPGTYDPATPGKYRVCPSMITRTNDPNISAGRLWWRMHVSRRPDSWGPERVPIDPTTETDKRIERRTNQHAGGRPGGFFIHGGTHTGTAGCIRLSDDDATRLFMELRRIRRPVGLSVR